MYNRFLVIALIVIGLVLPFANAAATGVGDVSLKINPIGAFPNVVHVCFNQVVEVWIRNDAPLYEISLGFQLSCTGGPISIQNYGTLPSESPVLRVDDPPSVGAFDNGLIVDASQAPNFLYIHGTATQTPLPAHAISTRVYSFMIDASQAVVGIRDSVGFENIVNQTTGTWAFTDTEGYPPTYCGAANASIVDPSAPARYFELIFLPCMPPELTIVPPLSNIIGVCESFTFQFDCILKSPECSFVPAEDENTAARAGTYAMWFARRGTITNWGLYSFTPNSEDTIVVDTVTIVNTACLDDTYEFTLYIDHTAPQFTLCNQLLRVKSGTSREVQLNVTDPDLCESHEWTLELLAPTAPQSSVSLNSSTGVVSVDANPADTGAAFDYRLICTDQFGKAASCDFEFRVVTMVPGDADDNGILTISDVVWLINYIFGGPGGEEVPIDRVDSDCNLMCNISDAVFLINYIFAGGPEPC